ncbi:kelch-like protein diablo isoform X2 [Pollicipes pollicipes]|uniref:kelch-like protein diablo isoform X2 n=1 Tax=Pollicipes pollicipes TaxID=41117 RepID=UPI0018851BA4|nr:kelch-like protein diablo isoform X2 [Pollicipes pollicipes]
MMTQLDLPDQLWQEQLLCDVTVRVEERQWRAHKAVLAAGSPYFRTMFTSDYVESQEPVVGLHGFDSDTFDAVLNYIYTGHVELSPNSAAALLDAAEHLQLSSLRHHCLQYLSEVVTPESSIAVWRLALLHGSAELAHRALRLVLDNFSAAVRDADFLALPEEAMVTLLRASHIAAREDQVLYALCRWTEVDTEGRLPAFRRLLRDVCVSQLDLFKLRSATELHPCLQDPEVRAYLDSRQEEALSSRYDRPTEGPDGPPAEPVRRCTDSLEVILAIGGATCAGFSSGVECLTLGYESWKYSMPRAVSAVSDAVTTTEPMARMAEMRTFAAVAADEEHAYVLGGFRDIASLRTCERYSVRENAFSPLAELPAALHGAAACCAGGRLFLFGGCLDAVVTNRVWMYCEERDEWVDRSPMIGARSHHCAAVVRGHIYAIGGIDPGGAYLSSVSRYDPDNDRWTVAPPCGPPRAYAACAAVRDQLFLIGGHSGRQWLRTVRRFSPLESQWYGLGTMPQPLGQFAAAVCDDRIYCVGGFTGCDYLHTVNKYNPRTDRWHTVHGLHMARMGLGAVTVRVPVTKGSEV